LTGTRSKAIATPSARIEPLGERFVLRRQTRAGICFGAEFAGQDGRDAAAVRTTSPGRATGRQGVT
jgi:hypothetical protein